VVIIGIDAHKRQTALMLADLLATRGAYDEAARWCSVVRDTIREDDLTASSQSIHSRAS
jgi:hypothetical protein